VGKMKKERKKERKILGRSWQMDNKFYLITLNGLIAGAFT